MPRAAIATPAQIRATILAMLAEAHDAAPATRERFRRIVSVRKLQARLGGGDPASLGRAINAVESEVVAAGLADLAIPDLPHDISELMRQLWQAAVGTQLDEVVKLKREANEVVETSKAALTDAMLRVDVLKQELTELRALLAERDIELAQARTDRVALAAQLQTQQTSSETVLADLAVARAQLAALEKTHSTGLAKAQQHYEGLSRQLLQETAQQRQALQQEKSRIASQLKFAEQRIVTLEEALVIAEHGTAQERDKRQAAVGEACALKEVNASQRAQIDELVRAALAPPPMPKPAAKRALSTKAQTKRPEVRRGKP